MVFALRPSWTPALQGDYQCNNAMMIFKEHGSGLAKQSQKMRCTGLGFNSPLSVAEAIRPKGPNKSIGLGALRGRAGSDTAA